MKESMEGALPSEAIYMELLQAGESEKQMAMNRQMHHRDKT